MLDAALANTNLATRVTFIAEMNRALAGSGGDVMVKLRIAEALAGKKILLLPAAGSGGEPLTRERVTSRLRS